MRNDKTVKRACFAAFLAAASPASKTYPVDCRQLALHQDELEVCKHTKLISVMQANGVAGFALSDCPDERAVVTANRATFVRAHAAKLRAEIPGITPDPGNDGYWRLVLDPRFNLCSPPSRSDLGLSLATRT